MKPPDLRSEIELERANVQKALTDIARVRLEMSIPGHSPTIITGAASYIAQCYGGVESILKRIVRYRNVALPTGGEWHIELLKMFRTGSGNTFAFVGDDLFSSLSLMRKFRHYVMHGYGFSLDRTAVAAALDDTPAIVSAFLTALDEYLAGTTDF